MPKKVKCPVCGLLAFYAVVPHYVWKRPGRPDVTIKDARIIRCGSCSDELPADAAEKRRWLAMVWKTKIEEKDIDEDQCDHCGVPSSNVGQFYYLGHENLCHSCKVEKYGEE